ncbi:MAG: MSHA biogenesis protein MshK [Betaproteobacteria bacterium]|nr:MSHA biogenesis protein MshK [Betaproteobacteria bacterium]MDH4325380.1 MSHA biogenesis protein MshK [Betaproteobacteria bacterium]
MKRALAFLLLSCAGAAFAQRAALVDPTRPPLPAGEPTAKESAPAGPQLQSILISPTRRVAVISGNTVVQGGKYGDATVAAISEGAVLLRYADRKETLHLIPGVIKRERRADAEAQSHKGNSR